MSLSVDKALRQAQSHLKAGELAEAEGLYKLVLSKFPKNKKAIQGYRKLKAGITAKGSLNSEPPQEKIDDLISHYNLGQFERVLSTVKPLIELFPKVMFLLAIQGAANASLKKWEAAVASYKQAVKIDPDYYEGYFNMADALRSKNELDEAIAYYKQAIKIKPKYAEAYNNMGNALKEKGDLDGAIDSYKKAIKVKPDYAEAYINMANTLSDKGEVKAGRGSYNKALEIKPDYAEAFNDMGVSLRNKGEINAAIDSCIQAIRIKPDYAIYHNNLGVFLKEKGDLDAAIGSYNEALKIKPDYAEAYLNMGAVLKDKGDPDAAIDSYNEALKIKPDYAEAYGNRGVAFTEKEDLDAAIDSYDKALNIKPDYAEAYFNMGNALVIKGEVNAAIDRYNKAINIKPELAEVHISMGNALKSQGELNGAMECYNKAVKIKPDNASFHIAVGNALTDMGDSDAAIESYKQALKIKPNYADAYYNQSLAHIFLGEFELGWSLYEWRWEATGPEKILDISKPIWEPGRQQRVLLWPEQGIGDEVMFASLINDLYAACSKLIVWVDNRLIPIFRRSFSENIEFRSKTEPVSEDEFDAHIAMGSLPLHFRPSLESFEFASKGYLFPDQKKAASIRSDILQNAQEVLIGISWNSSSNLEGARKRTIALGNIVKALAKPNVKLVSLQYGNADTEIAGVKKDLGIEVIQVSTVDNREDIDGLVAVMSACDEVVTIDNVTVHLAGAVGKETKLLLPYSCEWRWGRKRSKSYWYDSVRFYQQPEIGDWEAVLLTL
jgi:tetratricopeptide (TPR) repeat protein